MTSARVLLVEDGRCKLHSLADHLAFAHPDWSCVRVADRDTALEVARAQELALVVVAIDDDLAAGRAFLTALQAEDGNTIRLVMAGEALRDQVNDVSAAHQVLAVTCPNESIEGSICHGLEVWERGRGNPRLAALINDLPDIPTPPAVYFELRDAMASVNRSDLDSIASIVAQDPSATAKLLKLANSAFFGLPRAVSDLREAIGFLGVETVAGIVLSLHVFKQLPLPGVRLDAIWDHSCAVSAIAARIAGAQTRNQSILGACRVAGLLHDLGGLVLLTNQPGDYQALLRAAPDEASLVELEREAFGVGHDELGAHVLSLWGIPDDVVAAVGSHHRARLDRTELACASVAVAEWLLLAGEEPCPVDATDDELAAWTEAVQEIAGGVCVQALTG